MANFINKYLSYNDYVNDDTKQYPNVSLVGTDIVFKMEAESNGIIAKYDVTSTSEATTLLNSNTNITNQIIDCVQQSSVQTTYTFDTLGEHIVEYMLDGTSIGAYAFFKCIHLTSVTIGSGVTSIGNNAFQNCTSLTYITIPDSVTSIGEDAFGFCSGLTSITIPSGVTSIGFQTFINCTNLTSVTIGSGVTSIGQNAFRSCTGLTYITIPDSVTSIGTSAFGFCSGLTSITIPSGVTSIDNYAFNDCSSLTSITVEATTPPTLSDTNAFDNTNNCPIYVPAESVDTYKAAENWNTYASRLQSIPTT